MNKRVKTSEKQNAHIEYRHLSHQYHEEVLESYLKSESNIKPVLLSSQGMRILHLCQGSPLVFFCSTTTTAYLFSVKEYFLSH